MKTTAPLFLLLLLGITQLKAADSAGKFIREAGSYSLDDNGSRLNITGPQAASPSVVVTWSTPPGTKSAAETPDILKARGWFVYIENPNRVWVFDGVDQGALYTHQPKESGVKYLYFNQKNLPPLPQPFRDALPKNLRTKLTK
jgi:hypothetical protein